jgi:oligoendopeptidase F
MKKNKIIKKLLVLSLAASMLFSQTAVFAEKPLPKRAEVGEAYKWQLEDIYKTNEDFKSDVKKLREEYIPKLKAFKGKLNSATQLANYFKLDEEASYIIEKVYMYPNLMSDLDQSNATATELVGMATGVYNEYLAATSFTTPEILNLDSKKLENLKKDKKLAVYSHHLDALIKKKEHILSEKEETLLALAGELSETPNDIFDKVTLADFQKAKVKDKEGKEIVLTNSAYRKILESDDRDFRKRAALARGESYKKVNNTLAATYAGEIKKNIFFAKARGYNSALESSLAAENISKEIYENLVNAVNKNLAPLHKYYAVKKDVLGYDELHGYDNSVSLVKDYKLEYTYDEAVAMILEALKPLGEEYLNQFKEGIESRWLDVYEDDKKYTGGYNWGPYGVHPYILLNYDNSLDSALTLAHEMGHALNSVYSDKKQAYINADYSIFTAEVASTANELLVMDYLIKNAKSDDEKLYLLNKQIENIRGTVYTQVMFSEFEQKSHELVEAGKALSPEVLNNLWMDIMKKYYGESYTFDETSKYGWSRIPHFYMNFYVYKYATSISAANELVKNIVDEKDGATDKYLEFLAAGGSDYPVEILKKAGVDMSKTEAVDNILVYFNDLVNQWEELLKKQNQEKSVQKDVKSA